MSMVMSCVSEGKNTLVFNAQIKIIEIGKLLTVQMLYLTAQIYV